MPFSKETWSIFNGKVHAQRGLNETPTTEFLDVSCKNFIKQNNVIGPFYKRKDTRGEMEIITVFSVWMSHLAQSLTAFPPPLRVFLPGDILGREPVLYKG